MAITRRVMSLWVVLLALPLLIVACGGDEKEPVVIGQESAGETVTVEVGETFTVQLEGNPTTGYTWYVDAVDDAVVRQTAGPDFTPESTLVGAGGTIVNKFEARAAGETDIEMVYRRPFDTGEAATETFTVTVVVEGDEE